MFFCSSGGSEPLSVSKTDIVRGIITEKLTTAAQEIFAVVERIVTDYEAEASGFRLQVDRQRRHLELLQPRVKLLREELVPDQRSSHEVVAVGEEEEQPDEEEAESQDLLPWTNEGEEEEKPPPGNLGPFQDDLKDPDYIDPSRVPSVRIRPDSPGTSDLQNHVDLRIRLLEDSETEFLSDSVFKTTSVQELKCPLGLKESDFLDLLRSSFPQLANGEPFDLFRTNRNRKLLPLRVKALTPEEIYSTTGSTGYSTLYIRLKAGKDKTTQNKEEVGSRRTDDPPSSVTTNGRDRRTRVRKRVYRRRNIKKLKHLDLRILVLENSNIKVLSTPVYQNTPVQDLKCPRGLQESDFLDLLRSSFPQLANGEAFDFFTTDHSRRLLPLRVKSLTPEEIYSTINSSLYIRLKEGPETGQLDGYPRVIGPPPADPLLLKNKEMELHASPVHNADSREGDGLSSSSASKPKDLQTEEEAENNADPSNDQEALDEDQDWNLDSEKQTQTRSKRKRAKRNVKKRGGAKRDCKVCGVWYRHLAGLIKHSWSHVEQQQDVCGVCGEKFDSVEKLKGHLQNHQKLHSCSLCGKIFVSIQNLNKHTAKHAVKQVFKCAICDQAFTNKSSLYHHRLSHREEKPHQCDICQKSFVLKKQLTLHRETHSREDEYSCNICKKSFSNRRAMTQHRLIHSAERHYACKVCGKRFKLHSTLKSHTRTHTVQDRPFLCHICSKVFPSNERLAVHLTSHSGERLFVCDACGKSFSFRSSLLIHTKTHSSEAPYKCSECGRCFKWKSHLKDHLLRHSGIKRFSCGVCGKACAQRDHLKVHMRTHNGEKPYECTICEKAFTQSHCLKTHMKTHQTKENPVPAPQ